MHEPTKADKKILRQAIETGLQKAYVAAISALSSIIDSWKEKKADNKETYHSLYSTLKEHDKDIARRYDGITGSHYIRIVGMLFAEEKVTEADLEGLSEGTMEVLRRWKQMRDS